MPKSGGNESQSIYLNLQYFSADMPETKICSISILSVQLKKVVLIREISRKSKIL